MLGLPQSPLRLVLFCGKIVEQTASHTGGVIVGWLAGFGQLFLGGNRRFEDWLGGGLGGCERELNNASARWDGSGRWHRLKVEARWRRMREQERQGRGAARERERNDRPVPCDSSDWRYHRVPNLGQIFIR